jgi:hypothetical protein
MKTFWLKNEADILHLKKDILMVLEQVICIFKCLSPCMRKRRRFICKRYISLKVQANLKKYLVNRWIIFTSDKDADFFKTQIYWDGTSLIFI